MRPQRTPERSSSASAGPSAASPHTTRSVSRKRKATTPLWESDSDDDYYEYDDDYYEYDDDYYEYDDEAKPSEPKKQKTVATVERRLKRFLPYPPYHFDVVYQRATSQRFYVLGRTRCGTAECPEESVELTGSTGNIYTVRIAREPACTCPDAARGNHCKHIVYVMAKVLRAPFDLVYQLALVAAELREIFAGAPPPADASSDRDRSGADEAPGARKVLEGDCPICYTPLDGAEDSVYCRASCGQNMHQACFQMWAVTARASGGGQVTCPMCRAPWAQGADGNVLRDIKDSGVVGSEGYVNVAHELGISCHRGPRANYLLWRRFNGW
ncbi:hypothetical protein GGS23DRAFT_578098 [Durotheca rogersii]|uniref:uncharacterized protein n=1 Tax=Durotheca rogersii TaxID=419775 RepID=UPI0022206E6F|nr:uncharacterized protein GGS23DRAFT_578098 [Durotheca rogersii]KAI5860951.1 hypothetical protein GGS23DRAFT_578098 [Durotheca rogersii]